MNKTPAVHQLLSYMNTYKRRIFPTLARRTLMDAIHKQDSLDSIIFFTSHKCASVFVPRILRTLEASSHSRLKAIDYASEIWSLSDRYAPSGDYEPFLELHSEYLYSSKSFIYGPQRKPFSFDGIENFKKIFFLRDPRDVVVSAFYSFGGSHSLPLNSVEHRRISQDKELYSGYSIDDFALKILLPHLKSLWYNYMKLSQSTDSSRILICRYSDFALNTKFFLKNIASFASVDTDIFNRHIDSLACAASPIRSITKESSHKRSGQIGQWKDALSINTSEMIVNQLSLEMDHFGFL